MEGFITDGGHSFRDGDRRQADTVIEGTVADGCQRRGQRQFLHRLASVEHILSEGGDAFWYVEGGKLLTGVEGISPDGGHRLGLQVDGLQI